MDPALDLLATRQRALADHPLFARLTDLDRVRRFTELHVFAVWDFMSLLKALQRAVTCVEVPWRPSPHPAALVRMINEIVLGEESDEGPDGQPASHFELYLRGMREVGAETAAIEAFLVDLDLARVPPAARAFVAHTLGVARGGDLVAIAAAFFHGRERVIPTMFAPMSRALRDAGVPCPTLRWYLDRHVEVDGAHHGPLAARSLAVLCGGDPAREAAALAHGLAALDARQRLWDAALAALASAGPQREAPRPAAARASAAAPPA